MSSYMEIAVESDSMWHLKSFQVRKEKIFINFTFLWQLLQRCVVSIYVYTDYELKALSLIS